MTTQGFWMFFAIVAIIAVGAALRWRYGGPETTPEAGCAATFTILFGGFAIALAVAWLLAQLINAFR